MATITIGIENNARFNPHSFTETTTGFSGTISRNATLEAVGFYIPVSALPSGYQQGSFTPNFNFSGGKTISVGAGFMTGNEADPVFAYNGAENYSASLLYEMNGVDYIVPVFRLVNGGPIAGNWELSNVACIVDVQQSTGMPPVMLGSIPIVAAKLGTGNIVAAYLGTNQIF